METSLRSDLDVTVAATSTPRYPGNTGLDVTPLSEITEILAP